MAELPQQKIVLRRSYPETLHNLTLNIMTELFLRLNDRKIDSQFPWLSNDLNPFISVPPKIIELIMKSLSQELFDSNWMVQKEIIKILICKPVDKIDLSDFCFQECDLLDVLRMIENTRSKLSYLGVGICYLEKEYNSWIKVPEALTFLKEYVKSMPSLTSLNVSGICDDELLEAIALGCPNLLELVAESENITNEGLKNLCMKARNAGDAIIGCPSLKKVMLGVFKDDYFLEGIETLLLNLPNLRLLECSPITLGKAIENQENIQFQLRELVYDGSFHYSHLPSVIATRCPYVRKLEIENASNIELMRLEYLSSLREICISQKDYLLNFEHGIAPFLEKMGKRLESLFFSDVEDINFNIIDEYCPNLIDLTCISEGALTGKASMNLVFKNLKVLVLCSCVEIGLQPIDSICLLSNCYSLKHLTFECCKNLSREHLKEILRHNPLANLIRLSISSNTLSIEGTLSDLQSICNYVH